MAYTGARYYQGGLKALEIQNLLPSTAKTCRKFAKRHRIELSKIPLPDETVAIRLGPRKTSRVVIFFHGGGFMSPALGDHIHLAFGFAECSKRDVSVMVLPYGKYLPCNI
jgi:hypothetical protein